MQDYTTLKHSENGMPIWDSFYSPVLQVALTKDLWKLQDLKDATIKAIALPGKLATLRYASRYHDLVADNRIGWAISDLKLAGLLDNPKRGYYKISELGKKVLIPLILHTFMFIYITKLFVYSNYYLYQYKNYITVCFFIFRIRLIYMLM